MVSPGQFIMKAVNVESLVFLCIKFKTMGSGATFLVKYIYMIGETKWKMLVCNLKSVLFLNYVF